MHRDWNDDASAEASPSASGHRRRHRGLTALTSLLFVLALGFGQASFVASAEEMGAKPAHKEKPADVPAPTDAPAPADEGTAPDGSNSGTEEAPAEEEASGETADTSDDNVATEVETTTSAEKNTTTVREQGSTLGTAGPATTGPDTPGPPSGGGVQPVVEEGNPTCLDVMTAAEFLFEHKEDPPEDTTADLRFTLDDGTVLTGTLTVTVNESAETFSFSFSGDFAAAGVIVKGGNNANFFDYRPDGVTADTGLHAPVNPMNGKFYGLSHISFCIIAAGDAAPAPDIDVEKTCPASATVGEEITFTITVTNTGNEDLVDVVVEDTLFADLEFDADLSLGLAVGASATATATYTPGPGESSVENTVTADAKGAESDIAVSDTDSCTVPVTPAPEGPAIQIVKGGPDLVHRGDTITYQFEVTNIGDVELFDVELTDPICDPGTIVPGSDVDASLAVDEVWHFTCTHLVTAADPNPIENTVSVRGDTQAGEGGEEVTDTDDHVVTIITPDITIVKTVDDETVPVGTVVTYTYVVTNTGDTTLFNVNVSDDRLGNIGTIASLDPGESHTFTATFQVGTDPVTNVGTATGTDVLGGVVTDTDDASVTPIAGGGGGGNGGVGGGGGNIPGEGPGAGGVGGGTPFTGSDLWNWALLAAGIALIGASVLYATRRDRRGSIG